MECGACQTDAISPLPGATTCTSCKLGEMANDNRTHCGKINEIAFKETTRMNPPTNPRPSQRAVALELTGTAVWWNARRVGPEVCK